MPDIAMFRSKIARGVCMPRRAKRSRLVTPGTFFLSKRNDQPSVPIHNELPLVLCVFRKNKMRGKS